MNASTNGCTKKGSVSSIAIDKTLESTREAQSGSNAEISPNSALAHCVTGSMGTGPTLERSQPASNTVIVLASEHSRQESRLGEERKGWGVQQEMVVNWEKLT